MKTTLTVFAIIASTLAANCHTIYSKAYGNPKDKPLIFLHGGPGYNSVGFEATTAQKLSENGFYVIAYDRRGEGRSPDKNAKFTFEETFDNLNTIYEQYNLTSATLLGHSFGGIIATLYAEKYPEKTKAIFLISSPISMQAMFSTIIASSKEIYIQRNDSVQLNYIQMLENMDKNSIEYSSYCFRHAMQNGFYFPNEPTKEAMNIYNTFRTDTLLIKYGSQMTYEAPMGFLENEKYTSLNLSTHVRQVLAENIPVLGLYGKDDGLFSKTQISHIESLLGKENIAYLDHCSHNLFIDQQTAFINVIKEWIENEL